MPKKAKKIKKPEEEISLESKVAITDNQVSNPDPMQEPDTEQSETAKLQDKPSENDRIYGRLTSLLNKNISLLKTVKPVYLIASVVVLAVAISGLLYLRSKQEVQNLKNNPQAIVEKETAEIVKKVGKLIALPEGENPTVATVTDPEKLKNQPFFAQANKDDKVLIYEQAKKAILYRPDVNKVIDIAPISGSIPPSGEVAGQQTGQALKFAVLNGTNITGLARNYQKEIESKFPNSQVSVGDAKNKTVEKTFIVSISGTDSFQIASTLGIENGNLPEGEEKRDVDFIIILGADRTN